MTEVNLSHHINSKRRTTEGLGTTMSKAITLTRSAVMLQRVSVRTSTVETAGRVDALILTAVFGLAFVDV